MTAVSVKRGSASMRFRSVVLPLPRNPVSTVTGVTTLGATASALLEEGFRAPRAGMRGVVDLGEVLEVEMGIDLRRGDARVAQHLLDRAQVARGLQHVGCERMAQHMRVHVDFQSRGRGPALDAPLHFARGEAAPRRADEQGLLAG